MYAWLYRVPELEFLTPKLIYCVAYKNPIRTEMEFSYSQTENFEMEKLSSDTGYFKKPVEINRGLGHLISYETLL